MGIVPEDYEFSFITRKQGVLWEARLSSNNNNGGFISCYILSYATN